MLRFAPALLLAILLPGPACTEALSCPPMLEVQAGDRVLAPPGWQPQIRPTRHALEFAELYIGDPAKQVQLRGEDQDYPRLVFWELTPEPDGYMLICRYQGTEAVLQAIVPRAAKRCEIRILGADGRLLRRGQPVVREARTEANCG
jgi:hypothetical protein